ncbi:Protein AE7 [Diplonema papillatum]|nr:Protein AE7 [Diplonema papillatum]
MSDELINPNPNIYEVEDIVREDDGVDDEETPEPIDKLEVYELVRGIKDPEHPNTLEQLKVVCQSGLEFNDSTKELLVWITPTVTHCSQVTLIGLCIRVKLLRCLPQRFKVDLKIVPGTHDQEIAVNKQLNDKERVAAALENARLVDVINACLLPVAA